LLHVPALLHLLYFLHQLSVVHILIDALLLYARQTFSFIALEEIVFHEAQRLQLCSLGVPEICYFLNAVDGGRVI